MTPVGLWEDEQGEQWEIRRRSYGYFVRHIDAEGFEGHAENVRWRAERLKWTVAVGDPPEVRQYETLRIELHQMKVQWKTASSEGEEAFTRVSA